MSCFFDSPRGISIFLSFAIRNGYFNSDDEIIKEIIKAQPQILLVGLGSPKQEELIVKLKNNLSGAVLIGVGGSFDVFSGIVK